jgi:hypothetical protein
MTNIFARHQGKVFGPLTPDRAEALLKSGAFDATTEFAPAWDGPWGPVLDLAISSASEPRQAPPTAPARVEAPADHSLPPLDEDPLAFPGTGSPTDDVFANLGLPPDRPRARIGRLPDRSLVNPVIVAGVILFTIAVVLASLVAGRKSDPVNVDNRPPDRTRTSQTIVIDDGELATARRGPSSAVKTPGRSAQPFSPSSTENPRSSSTVAAGALTPAGRRVSGTATNAASAATVDAASRYANLSDEARGAIKAIRSLKASVAIGISFQQYAEKLQELLPPVQLFLESHEAQQLQELKSYLGNAMDCYVQVKTLWSESIFADSPAAKARATDLLDLARDPLLEVAESNVQSAYDLINPDETVRMGAISKIASTPISFKMQPVLTEAKRRLEEKRATLAGHAAEDASAGMQSRPKPFRPGKAFDRQHIDVKALRASLESVDKDSLSEPDAALIESFLSLTRSREWTARDRDKAWGDLRAIRPEAIQLEFKWGTELVARHRMSDASLAIVSRTEDLAEEVHALQQRLLHGGEAE